MLLKTSLDRLRNDLLELREIGLDEADGGIYRPAFSSADMKARQWLARRIEAAGGEARFDGAGNVIGRWFSELEGDAVVVGSHIDTVLAGGMLDGSLGVLAGLESIRVLCEQQPPLRHPIELIAFSDEEGRFGGMFGVQAFCGLLTPEWITKARDVDGVRLTEAMEAHGLNPMNALNAIRTPESIHCFIELHIEQGPVLEAEKKTIGLVEGISGVFKWMIRLIGKANHAGTAPMNYRSDAFMGLADFAHEIPRIIDEDGTDSSRLTVGKAELKPGNPHTIPGEVQFSLVGRDMEIDVMQGLTQSCRKVLSAIARRHNLLFEFEELSWLEPQKCHSRITEIFAQETERLGHSFRHLPSGAGHDTQFMAQLTPSGMIFVPSVGGISHAPDEWTNWSDVEKGANVLLNTLARIGSNSLSRE